MAEDNLSGVPFDRWFISVGALTAVLILGVILTFYHVRRLSDAAKWVARTHQAMDAITEVQRHLREAEAAQRTFLLTGGDDIPAEFLSSMAAAQQQFAEVKSLTADNPQQKSRFPEIERRLGELAASWKHSMAVRQGEGPDAAAETVRTGPSSKLMSEVDEDLRSMDASERVLLRTRLNERQRTYHSVFIAGLLSGAVAIGSIVGFVILLRRHLAETAITAAAIAEQKERYRTTLASIGDAVITTDLEGRVTGLNVVAEALTGWRFGEALGQPLSLVFLIVNEATRRPVENPAHRALSEGVIVGLANHTILIAKDGVERPIDDSAAPIRRPDGSVLGCVLVFRDISQRRALEREAERNLKDARLLATIVETSNDAIVSKTLDGIIQSWNQAAEHLFGYRSDEVIGKHISLIVPADRRDEEDRIIARLKSGERVEHYETERVRRDGQLVLVSLTISPLYDNEGNVIGASKIARDITARREVEERERRLLADAAAANSKFRAFFEQGALFAGIMNVDGTVIETNRLSWEGCGFTKDQIIGKPFWAGPWWSPSAELVQKIRSACMQAAAGQTFHEEMRYFVADGSERWADVSISPVMDESGNVLFLAPIGTDITDRKHVEEALRISEERFRTLADNMSQFAWMADEKGSIFWFNQRWFDYTGTTLEEMQGWGWKKVHHPNHVDRVVARIQHSWDTGEVWEDTFPLRGKDGNYRWFLSRAVPIRDENGKILRWFGTNTDVTERRKLEEDLRRLAADLSLADRRKDEFLATLAHELRNPLAAIYGAAELLNLIEPSDEGFRDTLEIVHRQSQLMMRLIDDLMDMSRITRGKFNLRKERVDLVAVVERALETSQPLIDSCGHRLTVDVPEGQFYLDADPVRLAQVFANLLNNAAKYSEHGAQISLSASVQGSDAVVSVKDTGIGIEADDLPRVFDMFSQLKSTSERSQGGLGIGLALVRGLVDMHGGKIEARSQGLGEGSEFIVRLPLAESTARADAAAPSTTSNGSPCRILIADDNRDLAQTLATILRTKGHEVEVAFDGSEALRDAEEFRPALALLDIGMPGMSGYDVAQQIREQPWGRNIFLAAMTGWGQEEDKRRASAAGFDHHLTKPVGAAEIDQLLSDLSTRRNA